jgi:FMN phosphatase YigB (HAD superfamily)
MSVPELDPRHADEWRVEVHLDERHHKALGVRLRALRLDEDARKRLGGAVIVTRDGPRMFLYAWHEQSAREAEQVVRDLLEEDKLAGEVRLMRWHPDEDEWKPATEPLPSSEVERAAEAKRHADAEQREFDRSGRYEWEVVIELPDLRATLEYARELESRGLPVKRRWKYVVVGVETEEAAVALGQKLESDAPPESKVGIRANPKELPHPVFVSLTSREPGVMRDLGI